MTRSPSASPSGCLSSSSRTAASRACSAIRARARSTPRCRSCSSRWRSASRPTTGSSCSSGSPRSVASPPARGTRSRRLARSHRPIAGRPALRGGDGRLRLLRADLHQGGRRGYRGSLSSSTPPWCRPAVPRPARPSSRARVVGTAGGAAARSPAPDPSRRAQLNGAGRASARAAAPPRPARRTGSRTRSAAPRGRRPYRSRAGRHGRSSSPRRRRRRRRSRPRAGSVPAQPLRVAGPVRPLVVGEDPAAHVVQLATREVRAPSSGWRFICAHSSSVRRSGLRSIESATPILPMSWRIPARRNRWTRPRRARGSRHHLAELADGLAVPGRPGVALVKRLGEAEHGREMGLGLDVRRPVTAPARWSPRGCRSRRSPASALAASMARSPAVSTLGVVAACSGKEASTDRGGQLDPRGGDSSRTRSSSSSANRKA